MATPLHCLDGMGRKPILCLNCRSVVSDDCCLVPLPQLSATVDEIEAHGNVDLAPRGRNLLVVDIHRIGTSDLA